MILLAEIKIELTEKDGEIFKKGLCDKFDWFSENWKFKRLRVSTTFGHKATLTFEIVEDNKKKKSKVPKTDNPIIHTEKKPQKQIMGRPSVLDDELKKYIRDNENMPSRQLSALIKEVFERKVSPNTICNFRKKIGEHDDAIKKPAIETKKADTGRPNILSEELEDFIINNDSVSATSLSSMIRKEFGKKVTPHTIKGFRKNYDDDRNIESIIEYLADNGSTSSSKLMEIMDMAYAKISRLLNMMRSEGQVVQEGGLWKLKSESEIEEKPPVKWDGG